MPAAPRTANFPSPESGWSGEHRYKLTDHRDLTPREISVIRSSKAHLDEVDERYFEHFGAALAISFQLLKAGLACALHALIPALCTRTASRCIGQVTARMSARGVQVGQPSQTNPVSRSSDRAPRPGQLTEPRSPFFSS
jgi:hypothetical protein